MAENPLLSLQNGSDIRGVAMGESANLTPDAVNRIAQAFVLWLSEKTGIPAGEMKIGVGHDSRLTARELTDAALRGIIAAGAAGYDCALASTPAMFMGTVYEESSFTGSIMMTASHLPSDRNGMKFFTRDGGLEKADIRALLEIAAEKEPQDAGIKPLTFELMALYTADLRKKIITAVGGENPEKPLEHLKITVDCGNGAGGFFVHDVLDVLGADTTGSQFLEPDGNFPNHVPNPENKAAMESIQRATLESKADLGLIFDTDVDRMSAVLSDGTEIARDALIAMMAAILAPDYPGGTIVTDSVTSTHLTEFIEGNLGLKHHRFKRGYRNVINEAKRLNDEGGISPLAIETSGHGAVIDNYFLDDGAYLAVLLISAAAKAKRGGRQLSSLIEGLKSAFESREYRIPVTGDDFAQIGKDTLDLFARRAILSRCRLEPGHEGVRIVTLGGWLLLRMSLHDPLLPLNMEGDYPGACDEMCALVKKLLSGVEGIDLSVLDK